MSVTFHLKRKKRNRKHGFLARMATHDGRKSLTDAELKAEKA